MGVEQFEAINHSCNKENCWFCYYMYKGLSTAAPDLTSLPLVYQVEIAKNGGWFDFRDLVIMENSVKAKELAFIKKRIYTRRSLTKNKTKTERWSNNDVHLLVELRKNKTFKQIANILGRTRYACNFKYNELKRNKLLVY